MTDYVFGDDAALRWSLLIVSCAACLAAAALLALGRQPYRAALAALRASTLPRARPGTVNWDKELRRQPPVATDDAL